MGISQPLQVLMQQTLGRVARALQYARLLLRQVLTPNTRRGPELFFVPVISVLRKER